MRDDDKYLDPAQNPFIPKSEPGDGDSRAGDRYLDPKTNPFLPQDEPVSKGSPEPDGRAPFGPVLSQQSADDLSALSARLDEKYGGGVVKLEGGVELAKLLGGWCLNGTLLAEASPAEIETIEKALREKEGG